VRLFLYLSAIANSGDLLQPFQISKPKQEGRVSQLKRQRITGEIPAARASPDELAERYLGLVIPIARSFQKRLPSSVDFDDLVGAGNLGLVEAARRFNPGRLRAQGHAALDRARRKAKTGVEDRETAWQLRSRRHRGAEARSIV